jgi:ribose transport system substrate-binding protein
MPRPVLLLVVWVALRILAGCGSSPPSAPSGDAAAGNQGGAADRPRLAFMVNGVADFWKPAEVGAQEAADKLGVDLTLVTPNGMTDQTRKLEDLLTRGTDGIAVSPINPENQIDILNRVADEAILVVHDSDAPQSKRRVYVGTDNYEAGLLCGGLVRQAIPEGGKVMLYIGRMDQDNSRRRRQGCIDAILGRDPDPSRANDPPSAELTSDDGKFTVLGTLTDQFDRAKAKANAEDTLTRHPDVAAMVGLFEYNPPLIMEALDRAGKLGKVKVIGFDENQVMLQGIKDGVVVGTVAQNPYLYGYESIRILYQLHQGDETVIPDKGFLNIPARVIDATNVDEFWADLKDKLSRR